MSAPSPGSNLRAPGVALVTGASAGVGQGIAVGLAEAGWTVHLSARNVERLHVTAARIAEQGGTAISHVCDHTDDAAVADLVAAVVEAEPGGLDLLINNVWAGPRMNHGRPEKFWERPLTDWDSLVTVGLRAHFVAAVAAVPAMVERGSGLIVNITSIGARAYLHSTLYGVAKAGLDKMTHDMAVELKGTGVSVVSLWPGLVKTDLLMSSGLTEIAGVSINDAETPELQGRVLAALAGDPRHPDHSGAALLSAELAAHYCVAEASGGTLVSPRVMFGEGPLYRPVGG